MRRGKTTVVAAIFEKEFFDGCQITNVEFDHHRRIITFYLQDDRFDPVPDGVDPYNYSVSRTLDGEVRFEK